MTAKKPRRVSRVVLGEGIYSPLYDICTCDHPWNVQISRGVSLLGKDHKKKRLNDSISHGNKIRLIAEVIE